MSSSSPITFSGIGSGLDVETLVTKLIQADSIPLNKLNARKQKVSLQQTQLDNLVSRVNTLNTAVKRLTAPSVTTGDPFTAKTSTVANKEILSVTANGDAAPQSFTVEVQRLATATQANSLTGTGQVASGASLVSSVAQSRATSGNFSVYVNGVASTIAVDRADTLDTVLTRIQGISGVAGAAIDSSGKLSITATAGNTLQLGGNGDTSNFLDVTGLKTATLSGNTLTASVGLNTLNPNADLTGSSSGLAAGAITADSQFVIGKATFTVTAGKTLNALVAEINNSTDAGVTASYNVATNKITLNSKTSGNSAITLQDLSGGNALQQLGLVTSGGNTTSSQTIGLTAQYKLNGGPVQESSSNTVTDALTGLTGITLNLTQTNTGSTTQVTVNNNNQELKNALKDIVKELNTSLNFIQEQTNAQSTTAQFKNDGTLLRFRADLRTQLSNPASGVTGPYTSLTSIGISTGPVTGASGAVSNNYVLDETKLDAALASNPENIKQLLVGSSGIITQLASTLSGALNVTADASTNGVFNKRKAANEEQIKSLNESVARAQARLDAKEKLYRTQFRQMDKLIAGYQSQSSSIANIGRGVN
jgi:flagellar hook-associated protein 2